MISVVVTDDGSHSILDTSRQETYHSTNGAISESRHVFIQHGLTYKAQECTDISVLEVGFGTGLNAFLTYLFNTKHLRTSISYTGVEKFPLSADIVSKLNYVSQLDAKQHRSIFERLHTHKGFEHDRFQFNLWIGDIIEFEPDKTFDVVYFDAFAPKVQPEIWDPAVFQKLKNCMSPGGILVTYCAQGQFKRTLRSLGFVVEGLPGPTGKREIVRAKN